MTDCQKDMTKGSSVLTDCTELRPAFAKDGRDGEGQKGMTKGSSA
jgi:hypothetical protein